MLVIRSGFIPRVLGILLMIAGVGYLASSFTTLVLPRYAELVEKVAMPLYFGELPIIFWLVIWGAKTRPTDAPPPRSCGRRVGGMGSGRYGVRPLGGLQRGARDASARDGSNLR